MLCTLMTWLDYTKMILDKVRFDKRLVLKELRKLIAYLSPSERSQLVIWCRKTLTIRISLRQPRRFAYLYVSR